MKTFIISIKFFLFFLVITGIIYPLLVTGIAKVVFSEKANGSLIIKNNHIIGSELIGQQFDTAIYFSSRPSAVTYNPLPSAASNFGLTNEKLKIMVYKRKQQFIAFNQLDSVTAIPSEMLFASASGLDPHISPEAALLQVDRIAIARGFNTTRKQELMQLVKCSTESPQLLCLGEKRINVLLLNLKLDEIK